MEFNKVTLTKEQWEDVAYRIGELGNIYSVLLRQKNFEGQGEQDARDLQADITCAVSAIKYVANFAADKCIFAAPKEVEG